MDEISETIKAHANFVWPDNKKPRVCILGGGFGGLYTALRLESLEWPEDKKTADCSCRSVGTICFQATVVRASIW